MATDISRNQERKGERLNDGLSALAAGQGPPLVILPGFGPGADLSVRVPRSTAWSTAALAAGFKRTIHEIHRPVRPPAGMTIATLAGWHATALTKRFGQPVDVMGISGGGVTALQLALDHPGTIRRLVVCVAASRIGERGLRDLLRITELEGRGQSTAAGIPGARLLMLPGRGTSAPCTIRASSQPSPPSSTQMGALRECHSPLPR